MDERIQLQHDDGYPDGFTLIDNRDIWDRCDRERMVLLRPVALGVYTAMRSLPKGWEFREPWLIKHLGLGRDSLRRIIRELEALGRLSKQVVRDKKGRYIRTIWTLHRAGGPLTGFPATADPSTAKPAAGETHCRQNRTRINKERASNTEATTTTPSPCGELVWPRQLRGDEESVVGEKKRIERLLTHLIDPQAQQDLLYQLGAKWERIGDRDSWMASMVHRAAAGQFVPTVRLQAEQHLAKEAKAAADAAAQREQAEVVASRTRARRAEAQKFLDGLDEIQVRTLAADRAGREWSDQIEAWLQAGRPQQHSVNALLRGLIG